MHANRLGEIIGHTNSLHIRSYVPETEAEAVEEIRARIAASRAQDDGIKKTEDL